MIRQTLIGLAVLSSGSLVAAQLPPVPVPPGNPITESKRVLGKLLFFEEQLSSDDTVACATCHLPASGGADPRFSLDPGALPGPFDDALGSPGVVRADANNDYQPDAVFGLDEQSTPRTAPTMIGAAYSPELFWDGRAPNQFVNPETGAISLNFAAALESQAVGPILSEVEMAHAGRTWDQVRSKLAAVRPMALATELPPDMAAALAADPTYPELFAAAFGSPAIDADRIGRALATYQRTLIPDQTPFDAFIAGDPNALTPSQQAGFTAFTATSCNVCHSGPLFSDQTFRNIGLRPWQEDPGRFEVTGNPADRGRFKVPTLRNVGLKPRFMHNGQLASLAEVLDFYVDGPGVQQFPFNQDPLVQAVQIPPPALPDVVEFLANGLTDPRVANELFPFDRPVLASERVAAELVELGPGHPGTGGVTPRWIRTAPAAAGSPDFKLGLREALPGTTALLAISASQAPLGTTLLDASVYVDPGKLLVAAATATAPGPDGFGHATVPLPLPDAPALVGLGLAGQWFVVDGGASSGIAATSGLSWPIH
ncbi:cytochrome-c peroxidase [Engelhardtia mirabilis]|uniref:Cytochrome c551 peroxidase n=1 Tax=Engelhardtia mirabilis TaxID=2528011 RepID=A0A518BHN5_9BACT|nr:Cytochrome c551 peroxidase precursor [Planctomycetes bacterium Pla133]QDV00802.1 Cytochrome c551 peroxidase precursor [Planctomycetes bacterium Pla86]